MKHMIAKLISAQQGLQSIIPAATVCNKRVLKSLNIRSYRLTQYRNPNLNITTQRSSRRWIAYILIVQMLMFWQHLWIGINRKNTLLCSYMNIFKNIDMDLQTQRSKYIGHCLIGTNYIQINLFNSWKYRNINFLP